MNKHLVAVYGSLKKGFGNSRLLNNATFIGVGKTFPVFKMVSLNYFPGLLDGSDSIEVEVYEITDKELDSLDLLEGYPNFYTRLLTVITLEDQTVPAWIYKLADEVDRPRYSNVSSINPSLISWSY